MLYPSPDARDRALAGAIAAAIFFLKLRGLSRQFTMIFLVLAGLAIILKYFAANYISGRIASRAPNRNAIVFGEPATTWA
jgi:hypothetical protein